ncbi:uncharacterized protein LOC142228205 isoform X2 [Haematobia irritans]|uniref:Uncharacterized protein n=1 Tax=Haematobia irritans TaxID=7368 RepID=A0A1L8ECC3_HAEIR
MGCCGSKDMDKKKSWSPSETNNDSTTSTIVAQPIDTGTFTKTLTPSTTNPPVFITEVIVEEGQRES